MTSLNILEHYRDQKNILIGDSSHGVHEFAKKKYDLSKIFISSDLISFVGVEWDSVDCFSADDYIHGKTKELDFFASRWPIFMFENEETIEFLKWMKNNA